MFIQCKQLEIYRVHYCSLYRIRGSYRMCSVINLYLVILMHFNEITLINEKRVFISANTQQVPLYLYQRVFDINDNLFE